MRWAAAVVLAACTGGDETPDARRQQVADGPLLADGPLPVVFDAAVPDSPVPDAFFVDACGFYDCFGGYLCQGGEVRRLPIAGYTCVDWPGQCPIGDVVYTCERGCAASPHEFSDFECSPRATCEEGRPKLAGDPCTTEADCRPVFAVYDFEQQTVVSHYLVCGPDETCVEGPAASALPDYLGACSPAAVAGLRGTHDTGVVDDPSCLSGHCMYADDNPCLRAGCTQPCQGDQDCPLGGSCQGDCPYVTDSSGWCQPGLGYPPYELDCVPEPADAGP